MLYVTEWENNCLMIGSELNTRKSFRHFQGVVVNKSQLIDLLKDK